MEWSSTTLRVLRAIAEAGSFTAAAATLGYTQSAVSRQVAVLERAAGARLFERGPGGVRLTTAGRTLLRHGSAALDEMDRAERILQGADPTGGTVRLGVFISAGGALIPEALALLKRRAPEVEVVTRDGSSPALTRSLRASTLDLAVISSRSPYPPPDDQKPALQLDVLLEGDLLVAVPEKGDLGRGGSVTLAELQQARWISSPHTPGDPGLGVWPALPQRPTVAHQARDGLSKLALVAAGDGVTTLPPYLVGLVPSGVRLVGVSDGVPITGRVLLARLPGAATPAVTELAGCVKEAATRLPLA